MRKHRGVFFFNIIPRYRPGISDIFDSVKLASLPSTAQRIKQNTFFGSLENICGQCLNEADLLYVFATDGDRDFAKINWKSPGNFTPTEVNTVTFTPNVGFNGNGSNSYLDTGWIPSADAVNLAQDNGGAFIYVNNNITHPPGTVRYAFGVLGNAANAANGRMALIPREPTTVTHQFALNSANTARGSSVTTNGFYHIRQVSNTDLRIFKDASQVGTTASGSTTLSDNSLYIDGLHTNAGLQGIGEFEIGIFGIGAPLTGQESALYTAWNTYFTSL